MNGWLAAAEKLLGRRPSLPPTPYEVTCACGGVVTGERTTGVQLPSCPDCQSTLFVLPASVYPVPKAPRRKIVVVPKPLAEPAGTDEDVEADLPPPTTKKGGRRPAAEEQAARPPKAVEVPRRPAKQVVADAIAALKLDRLRRKVFTPVKLVLGGVVAVVALTGWWIVHLRALDDAERVVVSAAKLGEQALQERDLREAARQFGQVRGALDVLGRNDSHARVLRQTARETAAAADLVRSSLLEILHEAAQASRRTTNLTWDETFHSSYQGEWVVLDANVARATGSTSGNRYAVDFLLSDGANRGVIVADLDVFDKFVFHEGQPQRIIFAAQLDDCRHDPQHENTWRFVLRPATAFLWSSAEHLELLGLTVDAATKQLLADQASHLGVAK